MKSTSITPFLPGALDCNHAKAKIADHKTNPTFGICKRCNVQFKGADIEAQFYAHKCNPMDSSQNALRIVRESTEDK